MALVALAFSFLSFSQEKAQIGLSRRGCELLFVSLGIHWKFRPSPALVLPQTLKLGKKPLPCVICCRRGR